MLFYCFLPVVSSVGVVPSRLDVPFYPGFEQTVEYTVKGYDNPLLEMLCPYVIFNNDSVQSGFDTRFSVTIKLPEVIDAEPGELNCGFMIREGGIPGMPRGVGGRVEVAATIMVHVPYKGRYATMSFEASNANKGDPVYFHVIVNNLGEFDLEDIIAKIEIKDIENKTKEILYTEPISVPIFSAADIWKELDTKSYDTARYRAIAVVDYGGNEPAKAESSFLIGKLFVNFLGMTKNATTGLISPISLDVESWWGNKINNVYANLVLINGSGVVFTSFKTISQVLAPWQKAALTGYLDAANISPGAYEMNISLHYDEEQSNIKAAFDIVSLPEPEELKPSMTEIVKDIATSPIFLVSIVLLLIIINIMMRFKLKKKTGNRKGEAKNEKE